jgi:cob(I)alamin adenosyltransferase
MNRIIIHHGDGRGKTSSAIGTIMRSLAHGRKVLAVQFFKPEADSALKALLQFSPGQLTVRNYGQWYFLDRPDDKAAEVYFNTLQEIKELIAKENFETILLDEVFYTVNFNLLAEDDIVQLLQRFDNKCFILTGRNAPAKLLRLADTVSCIKCEKHAFDLGIKAESGVEF